MPDLPVQTAKDRLSLTSRLADLTMVCPWVDDLAIEYSLSDETVFAINLCLEEALSNIIRHGHNEEPGHPLTVDACTDGRSMLLFTIEDQAPHFLPPEPMAPEGASRPVTIDELQPGGQGLPLLRRFANLLTWQQIPDGNRLTIGFDLALPTRGESS